MISILKIDLRESEKGIFSLLSFNSLFTGFSTQFFFIATTSYFIKNLSVSQLPIAFIFSGLAGYVLILIYKKIVSWKGLIFAQVFFAILYALISLLLYFLRILGKSDPQIVQLTAYLGFICIMPFLTVLNLVFSSISLQVFDISQRKRLLALVGLGEIVASFISSLIIPSLVGWWGGSEQLFLVSVFAILISLLPLRKILIPKMGIQKVVKAVNLSFIVKDSYFLMMAVMTLFSVSAIYLVDYSYLLTVKFISITNHIDTAILVSFVFCVIKLGEIIVSIYSSRFTSTYGLYISLLILPVILIASSALGFITGFLMPDQYLIITTFLLINKVVERTIRKGILVPSQKVLFQVTEAEERAKIQTLIEGTFTQIATFITGILILISSYLFYSLTAYWYLYVLAISCFVFAIGWLFASQKVYQNYKLKIQHFLNQGLLTKSVERKHSPVSDWFSSIPKKEASLEFIQGLHSQLLSIEQLVQTDPKSFYLNQIKRYNPRDFKQVETNNPDELFRLCSKAFFHSDSFESRMSICCYATYFTTEQKYEFIKENYRNLNHHLQYELLVELSKGEDFNLKDPAERFYVGELCFESCELIFWIELALDDLKDSAGIELSQALANLRRLKILQLFELLKLLYNSSSVDIIVNVWKNSSESTENEAFAVELLENLLEGDLKKIIIPLLSDMPLLLKKERLDEQLNTHSLDFSSRLIDIMLTNILNVDPSLKEIAAKIYADKKGESSIFKYYTHDLTVRLHALADGGKSQSNFNNFASHLRSKLHINRNPNHVYTEDFLFQSFFFLNTQLGFLKKSKLDQLSDQDQSAYMGKIEIDENEYLLSTYNLYLYLQLTYKY